MKTIKHLLLAFLLVSPLAVFSADPVDAAALRADEIARALVSPDVAKITSPTNAIYRVGDFVRVREGGGDVIVAQIIRGLADGRVEFRPRYGDPVALPVRNIIEAAGLTERFTSWITTSTAGRWTAGSIVAIVGAVATGATDVQLSSNKGTDQVDRAAAESAAAQAFQSGVENGPTLDLSIQLSGPFVASAPVTGLTGSWTPMIFFGPQAGQRGGAIAEYSRAPASAGESAQTTRGEGSWTRLNNDTIKISNTSSIYDGEAKIGGYSLGFPGTATITLRSGVQVTGNFLAVEAEQ